MDNNMNLQNQQNEQPMMRFDPMTGQPIYQNPQQPMMQEQPVAPQQPMMQEQPVMPQQPMMQQSYMMPQTPPMPQKPKKKFPAGALVGIIIGVVVVVAVVIGLLIYNGVFLSAPDKIIRAAGNTFEAGPFLKDINTADIVKDGSYTTDVTISVEGLQADATFATTEKAQRIDVFLDLSDGLQSVELEAGAIIDQEKVAVQIPTFGDDIYVYNFKEEKTGYITELLTEEEIELLDEMLQSVNSRENNTEFIAEVSGIFLSEFRGLNFEEVSKESFTVNGKSRSCKGYRAVVTADNALDVIEQLESVCKEEYGDEFSATFGTAFKELEEIFEEMPDMELTFYLYKNQLACIDLVMQEEMISIEFLGGERPMQNVRIIDPYEEIAFEIVGKTSGSTETTEIFIEGESVFFGTYDTKSGKFTVELDENYSTPIYMEGKVTSERSTVGLDITSIEVEGNELDGTLGFSITKGADIDKFEGSAVDLGTASEALLMDVLEDLEDALY